MLARCWRKWRISRDVTHLGSVMIKKKLSPAKLKRVKLLYEQMGSDQADGETARKKLLKLLGDYGYRWSDLEDLLRQHQATQFTASATTPTAPNPSDPVIPLADTIAAFRGMILSYLVLPPYADLIVALWAAHTYTHRRFMHSPRLLLDSPAPGYGKTTLLDVLAVVCNGGERIDDLTAAVIYQHLAAKGGEATIALDEGDNYNFGQERQLVRIFNAGHRRGGFVWRGTTRGQRIKFPVFGPMAAAAIGASALLKPAMLQRSIVIPMRRATMADAKRLRILDLNDPTIAEEFAAVRIALSEWARDPDLNLNTRPELPGLYNRTADNFRPLIAIADVASVELGELAFLETTLATTMSPRSAPATCGCCAVAEQSQPSQAANSITYANTKPTRTHHKTRYRNSPCGCRALLPSILINGSRR